MNYQPTFRILLTVIVFTLAACDKNREIGSSPYPANQDNTIPDELNNLDSNATWDQGALRLDINPGILKANSEDLAVVTATLYDDKHNPVLGKKIFFAATHGLIDASAITDSSGDAIVQFRSEATENEVWIIASFRNEEDSLIRVGRRIQITGLELRLSPQTTDALINTNVPISIDFLDAAGNPLSDESVIISGALNQTVKTNGAGKATITVFSSKQDTLILHAESKGAHSSTQIRFWNKIPSGVENTNASVRNIRLFASRSQLRADNSDETVVTAILLNEKNNPSTGDTVFFESNLGIIQKFALVDSTGRASVVLRSSAVNGICKIQAKAMEESVRDSIELLFTGLSLQLSSHEHSLRTGETAIITAEMRDASDNPIGGDPIVFQITGGVFSNDSTMISAKLDANGKATITVIAGSTKQVKINASALNVSDSIILAISQDNLVLSASKNWVTVGGADSVTLMATYKDSVGKAIPGAIVSFYTNAGVVTSTAITNANGVATAIFKGSAFSGLTIIQAQAANASTSIEIDCRAVQATQISLKISPDNIGVNGGIANLKAEVSDSLDNTVTGQVVSFRILKGPGGGESILEPTATSQLGKATSTLRAGSVASPYRAVLVEASIPGCTETLKNICKDTVQLTISGLPYTVSISRPQDDTILVEKAGELDSTVFRFFVGAVVQDVNGNPVADGSEVHFSASISGMLVYMRYLIEWEGVNSANDLKAVIGYRAMDIPFEDMNNNREMDPQIDLMLDFNDYIATRGEDVNGDGNMDWNPAIHDYWVDFNHNGICETDVEEPRFDSVAFPTVYADLDRNGFFTKSELITDRNGSPGGAGDSLCDDFPASGDFPYSRWETRPQWFGQYFDFSRNDYAVAIGVSAITKNGVAQTVISYPRQFANRLIATVNAESNGVRDFNGERFPLPVIIEK